MAKGKRVEFWPSFLNGGFSALGSVVILGLAGAGLALAFGKPDEDEEAKTVINTERVEVQGGAVLGAQGGAQGGDFDDAGSACAGVMQ